MKCRVLIFLVILTVSVWPSKAEANHDIKEVQEFSGTKMEGGSIHNNRQRTGRQIGEKEAARAVLSLSELISTKDAGKGIFRFWIFLIFYTPIQGHLGIMDARLLLVMFLEIYINLCLAIWSENMVTKLQKISLQYFQKIN